MKTRLNRFRSGSMAATALCALWMLGFGVPAGSRPAAAQEAGEEQSIQVLERASQAFTRVAKKATPAVVFIQVEKTVQAPQQHASPFGDPFDFFGDPRVPDRRQPRQQRQVGQGSGFIVTPDGYILTNNHVVRDADKITVRLHDGREFEAEHIGGDPQSEVAVIKIEDAKDLLVIALGDSDALEIGEWVIAIGNPFGLSETLTVGVVSAKGRSGIGLADYEDFIQTDAAINPGNSGGPLLNINGEVIGINTAIFTRSGGYMGIGFAVPINMARAIKRQLVESGEVTRGHLGLMIQEVTSELAASFGLDEPRGILVGDVLPDSPAEAQGLQQGDILLERDGRGIKDVASFRNEIALTAPGTAMELTIFRDGETIKKTVTLGTLDDARVATTEKEEAWQEKLGFTVQELTADVAERFGYEPGQGVLISDVRPHGPAARAGIRPGNLIAGVNRQAVSTPEEFYQALEAGGETVLLQVRDGQHSRFVAIRLR